MTIIILGANGMLARDIQSNFSEQHIMFKSYSKNDLSLTDYDAVKRCLVKASNVEFVINCAAYTKVDDCETNQGLANEINGNAVRNLAKACRETGRTLIHFSTDYVFNGEKEASYKEDDQTDPINAYGQSKLLGEEGIIAELEQYYILRVQWLYGEHGHHFIKTILNLMESKPKLDIVDDQFGSPTSTVEVARCVNTFLSKRPAYGIYHVANQGYASWYDLASYVRDKAKPGYEINKTTSEAFVRPAKRPKNGRLSLQKYLDIGGYAPLTWQKAVDQYLERK